MAKNPAPPAPPEVDDDEDLEDEGAAPAAPPPKPAKAKQQGKPINDRYRFTIGGFFFATDQGQNVQKPYEVRGIEMSHKLAIKDGALCVFKNDIAPEIMPLLFPGYIGLATHEIREQVCTNPSRKSSIKVMSHADMLRYIDEEEVPVELGLYQDADSLRQALLDWKEDPQGFVDRQAKTMEIKGPSMERRTEARTLNSKLLNLVRARASNPGTNHIISLENLEAEDEQTDFAPAKEAKGKGGKGKGDIAGL